MNATGPNWKYVNIGKGNRLVLAGNKWSLKPIMTLSSVAPYDIARANALMVYFKNLASISTMIY